MWSFLVCVVGMLNAHTHTKMHRPAKHTLGMHRLQPPLLHTLMHCTSHTHIHTEMHSTLWMGLPIHASTILWACIWCIRFILWYTVRLIRKLILKCTALHGILWVNRGYASSILWVCICCSLPRFMREENLVRGVDRPLRQAAAILGKRPNQLFSFTTVVHFNEMRNVLRCINYITYISYIQYISQFSERGWPSTEASSAILG